MFGIQPEYIEYKNKYFKENIQYECPICKNRLSGIQISYARFNFPCPSCGLTNIIQYIQVKENKQEKTK